MISVRVPQTLSRPLFSCPGTVLFVRWARFCAAAFLVALLCAPSGAAFAVNDAAGAVSPGSWQPVIAPHSSIPPRLIAVDKNKQQLFVFAKGQDLNISQSFICTTGQRSGDKLVQGDLKTPEGVYFVVQRLDSGLDYTMYGKEAYTLNYPNPVDRLRRKTGYGIWIHGRGEAISPLITQGCVAMNNEDLATIGDLLTPGTPVALTDSLNQDKALPPQDAAAVKKLENHVEAWARAWGQRSTAMFDFYDKQAYSIANEPFEKFQAQKVRLFKHLPWIKTSVRDVQVLQGPGYWVTWFYQEYEAPNLSTQGVRRLYWLQNDKGQFEIVGMEWAPGLTTGSQLAGAEPATPPIEDDPRSEEQAEPLVVADSSQTAPQTVPLSSPQAAGQIAVTGSAVAPVQDASRAPSVAVPQAASFAGALRDGAGAAPAFDHKEEEPLAEPKLAVELYKRKLLPVQTGVVPQGGYAIAAGGRAEASAGTPQGAAGPAASSGTARPVQVQPAALAGASPVELAALNLPPPLPAQQLTVDAQAAQSILGVAANAGSAGNAGAPEVVGAQPLHTAALALAASVAVAPAASPVTPAIAPAMAEPLAPAAQAAAQAVPPVPAPEAPANPASSLQIPAPEVSVSASVTPVAAEPVASQGAVPAQEPAAVSVAQAPAAETAQEGRTPGSAPGADPVSASILGTVEEWRAAWEKGDVDLYMEFYTEKAKQGARTNSKSIRKHKERLWAKAAPSQVLFADIRVKPEGKTATVDMIQEYADAAGGGDRGIKTLHLERVDDMWFIIKEEWSPVPQ